MVDKQLAMYLYVIAAVLFTIEISYSRWKHDGVHIPKDSVANFLIAVIGRFLLKPVFTIPSILFLSYLYSISPVHSTWDGPWAYVTIIFLYDLVYYVKHRVSHATRCLWIFHSVHHSSETLNFSVAARETWFSVVYEWAFLGPLCLVGFPVHLVLVGKTTNILFQFFIHSRYFGRLGFLEWFVNTPSHHRVHHGRNERYWDKNFGGILIIWDRLFGTFVQETEEVVYGITKPLRSTNILTINFQEMLWLGEDMAKSGSLRNAVRVFFSSPAGVAPTREDHEPQQLLTER